jgi:hypothetical protein
VATFEYVFEHEIATFLSVSAHAYHSLQRYGRSPSLGHASDLHEREKPQVSDTQGVVA